MPIKWTRANAVILWNVITWGFIVVVGLVLLLRTGSPLSLILVGVAIVALAVGLRKYRIEKNRRTD